jgi:hypothetical protein
MIKMKPLLKESTWTNRKFGESLPTLEDYMSEADNDDDKYVSIGWGKYKEKGKEDDENAPSFKKTDSGKYVKGKDDEKGKFTPDKKPEKEPAGKLGGGDFERDFDDDEDDYDMGVVPGSRELDDTPEDDDYDSEKGSSLTGAPGRDFEDDPDDIDNLDTALDGVPDPTRGDPDDSWDDEEGRAKPSGGDFTKSADYDMWSDDDDDYDMGVVPGSRELDDTPEDDDDYDSEKGSSLTSAPGRVPDEDDDEYAISGTDSDDPAGGKGDAWMTGKDKGMDRATDLAKKGMEKRPGGEQAEIDYQKADQMIKKYAGRDIEKAEFWAKKKKQAADAMMGEITIDGKKYKPITESIKPKIYDPYREIKKQFKRVSLRQFDRKWQK